MTSTPAHDGEDLKQLREEIDALKAETEDEIESPEEEILAEDELHPVPTDAIGSEDWDEPESPESARE